jgi:hypothetical protein
MKAFRTAIALLLVIFTVNALAQSDAHASFEKLKALQGTWTGKNSQGDPLQVVFRTTSAGSAILSEIEGKEDMITMFHMDGDRLMMTHYCGAGNQPRMVAKASPDGKTFTFDFLDGTNIVPPTTGHMQHMVLTIVDENHHSEDWTFVQDDGKKLSEHFDLQRKG